MRCCRTGSALAASSLAVLVLGLIGLLAAGLPSPAAGQQGEPPTNLMVLPTDITHDSLITVMRSFALGLGVRCEYCHVPEEPGSRELAFARDDDPDKRKARVMLRMVMMINDSILPSLPGRDTPGVDVSCVTCHHGLPRPMQMQDVLAEATKSAGADSAASAWRNLKERYYGSGSYDFGVRPVLEAARTLQREEQPDGAERLLLFATDQFPKEPGPWLELGGVREAKGDTTGAVAAYRKALEIDPDNRQAKERLGKLTGG